MLKFVDVFDVAYLYVKYAITNSCLIAFVIRQRF